MSQTERNGVHQPSLEAVVDNGEARGVRIVTSVVGLPVLVDRSIGFCFLENGRLEHIVTTTPEWIKGESVSIGIFSITVDDELSTGICLVKVGSLGGKFKYKVVQTDCGSSFKPLEVE